MRNSENPTIAWLKTNHPVSAINKALRSHLETLETALRRGVSAIPDGTRAGFYEVEIDEKWYYIHIPSRIAGIYLVAAANRAAASYSGLLAHSRAS